VTVRNVVSDRGHVRLGSESLVAAGHAALAGAVHGQYVQQADHGEEAVHLAALAADDREPAVLELESPERLDEQVHSGRVHERDLGQIQDYRAGFALEDRQQGLPQQRRRLEIDLPVGTEHDYVVVPEAICHLSLSFVLDHTGSDPNELGNQELRR
jgi:hypothetical protein